MHKNVSHTPISSFFKLQIAQKKGLEKLGLYTLLDLLSYFPNRYTEQAHDISDDDIADGVQVVLYGIIKKIELKKSFTTKIPQAKAILEDIHGHEIELTWFNQQYIAKMYHTGNYVKIIGKASQYKNKKTFLNPEIEKVEEIPLTTHHSLFKKEGDQETYGFPIYNETKGITSKWIYHAIKKIIKENIHLDVSDPIPEAILQKYNLPKKTTAYVWIHMPQNQNHKDAAKKRFAFEEIFLIQLEKQYEKIVISKEKSYQIETQKDKISAFIERFPFGATNAQKKATELILQDMSLTHPMSRLLEGDVGSGKTFVAATAAYATIITRPQAQNFGTLQVAYMAPTEILATQQFESFIEYFKHTGIQIALLTSSGCKKYPSKVATKSGVGGSEATWTTISKTQLTKWIAQGEISIVLGTHALIQKSVEFKHLALAIIDEQHRFGQNQRKGLAKKDSFMPHLLSMTATPIPRTLALTLYGGLDLTLLDELPKGRKKVDTQIVSTTKREEMYTFIKKELTNGRQAYIICPRIDEADPDKQHSLQMKSVKTEVLELKKHTFKEYTIEGLHSKMTKDAKEKVMQKFSEGTIDILVATSVVEVGVNVPNATVIVIEGVERFGLSQLHQLRGRVQRSNLQPYCFLHCQSQNEKTIKRMNLFVKAKNGFELAEYDLEFRGAGQLTGMKQSGISDLGMEAIKNIKLVEAAQKEAFLLIQNGYVPNIINNYHFE